MALPSGCTVFDATLTVLRTLKERDRDRGPPLRTLSLAQLPDWHPADDRDRLLFEDAEGELHLYQQHERRAGLRPPWTRLH